MAKVYVRAMCPSSAARATHSTPESTLTGHSIPRRNGMRPSALLLFVLPCNVSSRFLGLFSAQGHDGKLQVSASSVRRSDSDNAFSSTSRSSSNLSDSTSCSDNESLCSYRCLRSFNQESHAVFSLGLVHDGGVICGGLGNNQISVWRHSDATHLLTLRSKLHAGAVKSLLVAGDKLFSAHQDKKIRVWRLSKSNHTQHTLVATLPTLKDLVAESTSSRFSSKKNKAARSVQHTDVVSALALGDGVVYSASWDKTVKVWRLSDLKCIESFVAHDDAVKALVAKAGFLYTASADSKIKIWKREASDKKSSKTYHRHLLARVLERPGNCSSAVNALALGGDGGDDKVLYGGSSDSSISVWELNPDMEAVSLSGLLSGHTQAVACLATLRDLLCSGSADKTIRLWRRERKQGYSPSHISLSVVQGHTGPVKSIVLAPDRIGLCSITSGSLDGQAKMWRVYPCQERDEEEEESPQSERFYFNSSDPLTARSEAQQWKLSTIKHALDEGGHFFRLAFDTLQCS
ncbi:protein JINGUBANG [Selaginella moellendorffii]|uniref:protein JINGUBANG n=1 Tax=Selaginella moellendorffii TaxID=88036 RepID=UPI000D1C9A55|nr:protein JINGUBANG [Selaginella moellendorffii]|eukprot:XP_002987505.2 protein JINGUBANG [Selaginella moellendorffii]